MAAQQTQKAPKLEPSNFMFDLAKAIEKDQSTMSEQQLTDAESALFATKLEEQLYGFWERKLDNAAQNVTATYDKYKNSSKLSEKVQEAQTDYSKDNADAQSNETQQDAMVQSAQGQTQSDATNLSMKAQIMQAANSILTTLINMLGNITA